MDGMNGTELHEWALIENGRIRDKVHAELAAHAREFQRVFMAYRLLVPRPSLQKLAEWNADEQYGHEWRLNAARTDEELIAVYQAQLANYAVTKERLTLSRILLDDARREIATLRARIAELEQAVIFAEPAAPPDDVTRHLLNLKVSELAPLEALTKLMELKRMALESAPAPDTETPAAVRQHLRGQRKRVEAPPLVRKLAKMTDEEAEILFPDNQWEPADPDA